MTIALLRYYNWWPILIYAFVLNHRIISLREGRLESITILIYTFVLNHRIISLTAGMFVSITILIDIVIEPNLPSLSEIMRWFSANVVWAYKTSITLSLFIDWLIDCIVFNATFSNISAISWRPVLVVEEAGVLGENHRVTMGKWLVKFIICGCKPSAPEE
jgi:hypothetical protein